MVFEGIRPVLHIPFADTREQPVVAAELTRLATHMLDAGADGLVVPGLASESWALTESEREQVIASHFVLGDNQCQKEKHQNKPENHPAYSPCKGLPERVRWGCA